MHYTRQEISTWHPDRTFCERSYERQGVELTAKSSVLRQQMSVWIIPLPVTVASLRTRGRRASQLIDVAECLPRGV